MSPSKMIFASLLFVAAGPCFAERPAAPEVSMAAIAKDAGISFPAAADPVPRKAPDLIIQELRDAVILRQVIRRMLIEQGTRVTKDQIAKANGSLGGAFLFGTGNASGKMNLEQDQIVVEGGEFFTLVRRSGETTLLIEQIKPPRQSNMDCPVALYFDLISQKPTSARSIADLKTLLVQFRGALDTLEIDALDLPSTGRYQYAREAISNLIKWARGSEVRIFAQTAAKYEIYKNNDKLDIVFPDHAFSEGRYCDAGQPFQTEVMSDNFKTVETERITVY